MPFVMPRIVISALSGGSGKTMLSVGLARALTRRGHRVQTFKKGPDYIDTLWAGLASGLKPRNLDPYMIEPGILPHLFETACKSNAQRPGLAIIEGNRGLFDGLDLRGSCSTAELARQLSAPVLLTVNCTKMTRTTAALVKGCKDFEAGVNVAGVVLNQASRQRHRDIVKQAVEELAGVPVLGAIPRMASEPFEERHNGLLGEEAVRAGEAAMRRLDELADVIEANLDLEAVLALAQSAPPLEVAVRPKPLEPVVKSGGKKPRIGYVRDLAFWFYYTENLEALERAGAELVAVSLLDENPWPRLDGLYMGAGLPEDFAAKLADNNARKNELSALVAAGLPVYAEGSAIYYLGREMRVGGQTYPMCGVFDFGVEIGRAPQGIGYVRAVVEGGNPFHPAGVELKAHEFHYSRLDFSSALYHKMIMRMDKGGGLTGELPSARDGAQLPSRDGLLCNNCQASHFQIFAPGAPHWAVNFVRLAADYAGREAGS